MLSVLGTQTSTLVTIYGKLPAKCGYVQGRMTPADILSRPPHVPLTTLPDLGQSNGGPSTPGPLALLPNQLVGLGSRTDLAAYPRVLVTSGILYMLGQIIRGKGTPAPCSSVGLYRFGHTFTTLPVLVNPPGVQIRVVYNPIASDPSPAVVRN